MIRICEALDEGNYRIARALFREYADSLGVDLDFQDFENEVRSLPGAYAPPGGCILLAEMRRGHGGCAALRPLAGRICEMKRLYVRSAYRALGIGRALAEAIIERARAAGYARMRLDTLATMHEAARLYASLGFHEIAPYRHNPLPGARFFELAWEADEEHGAAADMTAPTLEAIAVRWIEEVWQRGHARAIDDLRAPEFVDHDPGGRAPDREGFKLGVIDLYAAFPDFRAVVEDVVVDAARGIVSVRWSARGTHAGPYLGIAPTGRCIRFKGIEIIRIVGGRIVERWGEWDGLDLIDQLRGR
jgi:putative acetyltransferase